MIKLNETNQKIYDYYSSISRPRFELVMGSDKYSDEYKRGFSEAFCLGKADLFHTLLPRFTVIQEKPISTLKPELLEYFIKVIGKIEAFYNLSYPSDEMSELFTLIEDELDYIKECITELIKDE